MRNMKTNFVQSVTLAAALAFAAAAQSQMESTRSTIDGGGVMFSAAGDLELCGTIGQPDAGVLSGGDFMLTGGFWFETPPGDCDDDGGTGLRDLASFEGCMMGPHGAPPTGPCRCFDMDRSGAVDLIDFGILQTNFTGE